MAKQKQPFLGVFENMDFPDYEFREYPKVVGYRDAAKIDPIIVNDQKEEIDFITTGGPGAVKSKEEELKAELDRKALELQLAKEQLEALQKAAEQQQKAVEKPVDAGKIVLPEKKA